MRLRAGRCLATVRLLIATTSAHTFAGVAAVGTHVLGADGARDRDPRITGFIRTCGRLAEELRPQLLPHCLRYVFSDLPRVAYQSLLWTVPRVEVVNSVGLERFLQCAPPLPICSTSSDGTPSHPSCPLKPAGARHEVDTFHDADGVNVPTAHSSGSTPACRDMGTLASAGGAQGPGACCGYEN